jgi:hypothetical protein
MRESSKIVKKKRSPILPVPELECPAKLSAYHLRLLEDSPTFGLPVVSTQPGLQETADARNQELLDWYHPQTPRLVATIPAARPNRITTTPSHIAGEAPLPC